MGRKTLDTWTRADMLPGDTDRDLAVKIITTGHVDGRISMEDMTARIDRVNDARSVYELHTACSGLPAMQPRLPVMTWQVKWCTAIAGIPGAIMLLACGEIFNYTSAPPNHAGGHSLGALHALAIPFIAITAVCLAIVAGVAAFRVWEDSH